MQNPPKRRIDSLDLHPNLVLGSLQLFGWLLFHPSARRDYVAQIDSALRPDFALIGLSRAQWQNPRLRRLLVQECLLWNLMFMGLAFAALAQWSRSIPLAVYCLVLYALIALVLEIMLGPAAVGGVGIGGLLGGIVARLAAGDERHMLTFMLSLEALPASLLAQIVWYFGVAACAGVMGSLLFQLADQAQVRSLNRQVGGWVIGLLLCGALTYAGSNFLLWLGNPSRLGNKMLSGFLFDLAFGVCLGLAIGITGGWRSHQVRRGAALGLLLGALAGAIGNVAKTWILGNLDSLTGNLVVATLHGITYDAWWGIVFVATYLLAERIGGRWAGMAAGVLCLGLAGWLSLPYRNWSFYFDSGYNYGFYFRSSYALYIFYELGLLPQPMILTGLATFLVGLTQNWWRPVLFYPFAAAWNTLLYRADLRRPANRPSLLRHHSAFWDEAQRLPLLGLEDHLVLALERDSTVGQAALEYLKSRRQGWAAQAAQQELDARYLEHCLTAEAIADARYRLTADALEKPRGALLRSLGRISQDVEAALRQESVYNQRMALGAVEDRLDSLLRELTRGREASAVRFRPIVATWRQVVADHMRTLAAAAEQRQEIDSPYIIGVPLTAQQELFVGRTDVIASIEGLLLDRRHPPMLLYGQRRMGKTSLLNNLGRLLPSTIVPLFVDLQGPVTQATSHAGLLYNLARGMADSARQQRGLALPALPRAALEADPFTAFDEWLDAAERALAPHTALLALDEFEALDGAITHLRFDEVEVLNMLRHLIQHRPRFKVLLAGSHTLDEMRRWATYLVNVQTLHLGYLEEAEACQLVERPVAGFVLRYTPEASQRVLTLTHGHPTLVQLLCAEIVAFKNRQPPAIRRLASLPEVEAVVPEAMHRGSFFFTDIEHNQVTGAGRALLRFLAAQGEGAVASREALLASQASGDGEPALDLLVRRELIERVEGGFRFQVELIRRWFTQG